MNNAELFKRIFGIYAEEFWAYPKEKMLDWLTFNVPDTNVKDLISRQDAIDAVWKTEKHDVRSSAKYNEKLKQIVKIINAISEVPSAQSERKKGKWIDQYQDGDWHCSCCGAIVEKEEQMLHNWYFCYHCGAEMED